MVTHYLRLAVLPSPLVFLYDWPLVSSIGAVGPQLLVLAGLVVLTVIGVVRRAPLAFAGAWFFLILAPTSIVPIVTEVAAEHRMYLPVAAVISCAVLAAFVLGRRVLARVATDGHVRTRVGRVVTVILTVAVVVFYGTTTRARNLDYVIAERLWGDTVAKQPASHRARVAYAEALTTLGRLEEAEAQLAVAVERLPDDAVAQVRLGSVLAARGKVDEAIGHLERALALDPNQIDTHRFLGIAYAVRGQETRAVPHLERALAVRPDDLEVLARLAAILANPSNAMVSDGARAVALAERAVQLTRRQDPLMLNVLGVALAALGRTAEAASVADEGLALARAQGNEALARGVEYPGERGYRSMRGSAAKVARSAPRGA